MGSWVRLFAVLGVLSAAGLVLAGVPALAGEVHEFKLSFGSVGFGDGQVLLAEHSGLAVNEATHDVYVADTGNHRVDQFDPSKPPGEQFVRAFGADVGGAGVNVCTSGCVAGTPGSAPGAFEAPTFIAVDNSAGASKGDVYVGDTADNLVSKFEADGTLLSSWGAGGQLAGNGSEAFEALVGVAVGGSGALSVMWGLESPGRIFNFDQAGVFTGEVSTPRGSSQFGLAVDPAGDFFKVNAALTVERFEASGEDPRQININEPSSGLAVDPSNAQLYIDGGSFVEQYAFEPSGEVVGSHCLPEFFNGCQPTSVFGAGHLIAGAGVAVDGTSHTVYVADAAVGGIVVFELVILPDAASEAATEVGTEAGTLNGTVNPGGVPLSECFFEWGESPSYGKTAPCEPDPAEVGEGKSPVAVHAKVSGLSPGTQYHFRVVAANANGATKGEDEGFQTLGPAIKEEAASQVGVTSARISALINPNGEETSFFVQYVTEAQFQQSGYAEAEDAPVVPRALGSGTGFQAVAQQLNGLTAQTSYHFRLVALGAAATVRGPGATFSTFAPPSGSLPDGRAYELVSPPRKAGEVIPPEPASDLGGSCGECLPGQNKAVMPMQSTADGESVLFEGQAFSAGLAAGPNEYLAGRAGSGWGSHSLSSPTTTGRYEAFSPDLSRSVLSQVEPALSPEAPSRAGKAFANLYLSESGGPQQPLVTEEPPHRDPGFSEAGGNQFRIRYAGANTGTRSSAAFSHLVLEANDALTAEVAGIAPEAPEVEGGDECTFVGCDLYEWAGGQLHLVNVLPGNEQAAAKAAIGSGRLLVKAPQYEAPDVDRAISADGSRIFWSTEESGQVYVRIGGERTLEVPGPGSCKEGVPKPERACFLTASADGSRVLLSDGEMFELNEKAESYEPSADLTKGHAAFKGILGAAGDLSRVYFIDTEALTGGEEANANEEHAEAGAFNLYAWDRGATRFIGRLDPGDNGFGVGPRYGAWKASPPDRTAQVSLDGGYVAFMSEASLTGYDNSISGGGVCGHSETPACREVFIYAAESGTLTCASCNPSGERPLGPSNLSLVRPGEPPGAGYPPFPQPGNLSSDGRGRLFFESQDALTPQDTNGRTQDVYEWEPGGVGGCGREGGCVALISSGHSANDSMFVDSTPSGNDAFFITRERLLSSDQNEQLDLYDARAPHVPGEVLGFPEGEPAPCGGESCKGPLSSPPAAEAPASSIFAGPGNFALTIAPPAPVKPPLTRAQKLARALKACARKPRRKRPSCRAQAKRRYAAKKANTANPRSHRGGH
jgi:DNA-binding beta-propeller fold protein YncE